MTVISHVIDYGAQTGGSFIPALNALARALTVRGDRLIVLASDVPDATWPEELSHAGADVRLIRNEKQLISALRSAQPDIVHAHFTRFDLAAVRAVPRARIFWHVHSHRENHSALAKLKALAKYRLAGRRVECFVTVSETMRDECVAWFADPQRIRVIHNAIDPVRFRPPSEPERAIARSSYGISPHDRAVLFFDRVAYKGADTVRKAAALLPDVHFVIAGATGASRERFLEVPNAVTVDRVDDARQLYWAVDALVFASNAEAFGLVLIEALACGLPIAASDIRIVREICGGLESVCVFPPGDSAALAQAVKQALKQPYCGAGRTRVLDAFSLERWTADMLRLYGAD